MKRYILVPGNVMSKRDGQQHYLSPVQLARFYRVRLENCIVLSQENLAGYSEERIEKFIWLCPQYSGNYTLPKTAGLTTP
jgi:hypothetical protein